MGMNTTVIPSSVVVDNVTIETNVDGEIQIKGGGVSQALLDDYIINAVKLAKTYSYDTTTDYLTVYSAETSSPGDVYTEVFSQAVTMNLSSTVVRFNLDLRGSTEPLTSYAQIKVNGSVVTTLTHTTSTYTTKAFDLTLSTGDVVSIETKTSNSNPAITCKTRNFKIKGVVETIAFNSYDSL